MSKRKASKSKRRSNFTGAEVEVLLQNVDVSILFHYGYIHAIEYCLFIYSFTTICSVRIVLLFMLGQNCPLHFYHFTTYCYTCTANVLHTSHRMSFAAFFCTTCHFKVNLCCCTGICMCITICICISTCLVLSVVVRVHLYVSPWESGKRFFRFLCMS